MILYLRRISFLGLILLAFSGISLFAQDPAAGRVIPEVSCIKDSSHHYALYLPSYFYESDEEDWPVIYAFDAAARGVVPVELFSDAAEKYGYIIAGSNISENGPWEHVLRAAENMMRDVESRFPVNGGRRYTAGFSGGARVATSLAVLYGTFEGVIGCGAGFSPNYPPNFDMEFSYIGLIGDRDLNYLEMNSLDEWLSKFRVDHYIYQFPGNHEWPEAEYITDAVTWLEFRAMKNDLIWIDYGMREDFYEQNLQTIHDLIALQREFDAYKLCLKVLSYLDGIRKLDEIVAITEELYRTEVVKKENENERRVLAEERSFYRQYQDAFLTYRRNYEDGMTPARPPAWWRDQLKIAREKIEEGPSEADKLMGHRMIDFIWRNAYAQYEGIQGTEFQSVSKYYLDIWAITQPESITPYFFLARYYTLEGKYSKAFDALSEAIERGLDDPGIIENDPVLVALTSMPEYERLTRRLH